MGKCYRHMLLLIRVRVMLHTQSFRISALTILLYYLKREGDAREATAWRQKLNNGMFLRVDSCTSYKLLWKLSA